MSNRSRPRKNGGAGSLAVLIVAFTYCVGSAFSQCQSPLDEQTINSLAFNTIYSSFQSRPGGTIDLDLGIFRCCVFFQPLNVCAAWSVNDSSLAQIDPQTGVLKIEQKALPGGKVTVTANVENGRRVLAIPVYIYSLETHPLVGVWTEIARFSCDSGNEFSTQDPIRELVFLADGSMYVTRTPFEVYHDYKAIYEYKPERNRLSFMIEFASARPISFDGAGRVGFKDDGRLVLKNLSLGRFSAFEQDACRYLFRRVGS